MVKKNQSEELEEIGEEEEPVEEAAEEMEDFPEIEEEVDPIVRDIERLKSAYEKIIGAVKTNQKYIKKIWARQSELEQNFKVLMEKTK